jgi:hypothetical protein
MDNEAAKRRKNTRGLQLHCEKNRISVVTGLNGVVCIISTLSQEYLLELSLSLSLGFIYFIYVIFLFNENSFSEGNKEEDKSLIQNQ